MPQNTTVTVPAGTWVELTSGNVTSLTFQVRRNEALLMATVGAVPPTTLQGTLRYKAGQGEVGVSLANMFPGVTGANRVYAYAPSLDAEVSVQTA